MKYLITIILIALAWSTYAQNNNKTKAVAYHSPYLDEIDNDFITHIFSTRSTQKSFPAAAGTNFSINDFHSANFKQLAFHYESANNPKFDFLVDYYNQMSKFNSDILDEKFLKKPSLNDLLSIYLNTKLKENSFNDNISKSELITWELEHFPTMESLLTRYYSSIFYQAIENNLMKKSFDIDFVNLGLSEEEGTLLYYVITMRFRQSRYDKSKLCKPFKKAFNKLPSFNGEKFSEFKPVEIDDITVNIRHQNKFWNTLSVHQEAHKEIIDQYKDCQK